MRRQAHLLRALALGALLGCRQTPGPPPDLPDAAATTDIIIPLLPYFRDLRVVRVQVGHDSLTLLLDTGGGATLITPEVASAQGCRPHGADQGYRMTGEAVVFARCDSIRVSRGAWTVRLSPAGVFDVNALLPRELPRLDGVLALDAFVGRVVTLDWNAGVLRLHGNTTGDSAVARSGVKFRPGTGESGRFLSALAQVEGTREPLWFLLDTGNLRGTLVAQTVLQDSLLPLRTASQAQIRLAGRPPLELDFAPAALSVDGALGTDFFRLGPVTLDLRNLRQP